MLDYVRCILIQLLSMDAASWSKTGLHINTLRQRQNGRLFPDDIFKCIFLNETAWISIQISLKFVPKVPINNIPALVQIMAWRRPGDKPLSEAMMASLLMHICATRHQWVKRFHCWNQNIPGKLGQYQLRQTAQRYNKSLSSMRNDFNYPCHPSAD